jgi:hypothetical protein
LLTIAGLPDRDPRLATIADTLAGKAEARAPVAYLSQAEKARQLGVSRFTIRKMVEARLLHPVQIKIGAVRPLIRYAADEVPV